jgi:UrcA family protein
MNTITRSNPIRRTLAVGIVSACALGFGTITAAADELGVPKANIRYSDLNLATPQGAKVLYERIISASYAVCQSFGRDRNDNADPSALQACRKKIVADAVTKIGRPALYAVYNARSAKPLPAPIVTAENRK